MAVYQADTISERPIYGSSRLGNLAYASKPGYRTLGYKQYELSNHLGNVLAVVSDRIHMKSDSTWTDVISRSDGSCPDERSDIGNPFGLAMGGRTESSGYRYGFNGKEKDPQGLGGGGSTYDYGFRIYNPEIAKFLSVDPLTGSYPMLTPYQFASNTPIQAIDLDGLEAFYVQYGLRGSIPIYKGVGVTSSYHLGIAFDFEGNIGIYQSPSLGVQGGLGIAVGGSGGLNWQAKTIHELSGYGMNLGGFLGGPAGVLPFEASGEVNFNPKAENVSELISGFNFGIPKVPGITAGASIYLDGSRLEFIETGKIGRTHEDFISTFNTLMEKFEERLSVNLSEYGIKLDDTGYDSERFSTQIINILNKAGLIPEEKKD